MVSSKTGVSEEGDRLSSNGLNEGGGGGGWDVQTDSALKVYLQTDQMRGEEEGGAEVSELLQWVVAQLDLPLV